MKYHPLIFATATILLFGSAESQLNDGPPRLGARDRQRGGGDPSSPVDSLQSRAFLDAYDYEDDFDSVSAQRQTPKRSNKRPNTIPTEQDCRIKSRTLPHEKYCDLYYHATGCDDGQSLLRSCPNGLLFTGSGRPGLIGVCDYPHNVDCRHLEKHNPPISTEHCDWLYGIFGHETSCTRYWTCWNGTATEQFCVGGLLYNEETHACDWPQNVVGCQKHPLCKDDANGNVPLGKSCNRYWACQGGYPRLQRCPAMLVFDKTRKRCVAPPTEDCDVPPTTNPPDEDNNNSGRPKRPSKGDRRRGQQQKQQQQQQQQQFQLPEGALQQRPGGGGDRGNN